MTHAHQPLPYTDDVETIPADEAKDIERVVLAMELILARTQAKSGEFRADVHVKAHGYAQGEFRVLQNLPRDFLNTKVSTRQWFGFRMPPASRMPMRFRTAAAWRSRCWE